MTIRRTLVFAQQVVSDGISTTYTVDLTNEIAATNVIQSGPLAVNVAEQPTIGPISATIASKVVTYTGITPGTAGSQFGLVVGLLF